MTQVPLPPAMQGLGSSPFARRYSGNRFYFLFLRLLRCFSSPRLPPLRDVIALTITGCPIRIFTGLSLLTARRDFSQLTTSFFATLCQGIHHVPLFPLILSLIHITHFYKILSFLRSLMVENIGLEPMASALQGRRSPN